MSIVAPSLLASDFSRLESEVKMINESQADIIHVDIMDGVFVPNISMGFPVVEAIKRHATKPLDVHLMIVQPERYLKRFREAGADIITVHEEACPHLHRTLQEIKETGAKAGVALNPHTRVATLENVIEMIDVVILMSVNPGFGGQTFIEGTFHKITQLKKLIQDSHASTAIEIDGGVNLNNAKRLLETGADILVAGNFVFSAKDPKAVIHELKSL